MVDVIVDIFDCEREDDDPHPECGWFYSNDQLVAIDLPRSGLAISETSFANLIRSPLISSTVRVDKIALQLLLIIYIIYCHMMMMMVMAMRLTC